MEKIETKEQFEEKIQRDSVSVVKFETTWCPDCKRLNMFIEPIIKEHADKEWYAIDRDQFPDLSEKYDVRGIPSLLVFKNGEKLAHLHSANAKTPEQVREFLASV